MPTKKNIKQKKKINKMSKKHILDKVNNELNCDFLRAGLDIHKLGEGKSNYVVSGCLDDNQIKKNDKCVNKVAFRIMGITNDYPVNKLHPVNFEVLLYKKLNKLVDDDKTPHIVYLYRSLICDSKKTFDEFEKSIAYRIKNEVRRDLINKNLKILMLEYANLGHINSFVKEKIDKLLQFKVLFFQVMSMLVTTQYHIPNFIHGDIHANNIVLKRELFGKKYEELQSGKPKYILYKLFGKNYYIPWVGFSALVFDFDLSRCDELKNAKMNENYVKMNGLTENFNPVFDYHLFINSLMNDKTRSKNSNIPEEIFKFYEEQVPSKYRGHDEHFLGFARLTNYNETKDINNTNLIPSDIRTPSDVLLNHKFFDIFRKEPDDYELLKTYDSKVPNEKTLKRRKDMFK
jgi:hypothetical protein